MQSLWTKTQSSPFEAPYFSCVPYLLGEAQAMQYSFWPKIEKRRRFRGSPSGRRMIIYGMPWSLRFAEEDVELDFRSNCRQIPISFRSRTTRCSGRRLSPRVSVATCAILKQNYNPRRKWRSREGSLTTRGTRSPSIARSGIKAARVAECIRKLSKLRHTMNKCRIMSRQGTNLRETCAMTPQASFMILAAIAPAREGELAPLLASMNQSPGRVKKNNAPIPFARVQDAYISHAC